MKVAAKIAREVESVTLADDMSNSFKSWISLNTPHATVAAKQMVFTAQCADCGRRHPSCLCHSAHKRNNSNKNQLLTVSFMRLPFPTQLLIRSTEIFTTTFLIIMGALLARQGRCNSPGKKMANMPGVRISRVSLSC